MAPAISVIITAHNYGRFLTQCIDSVLAQTFQDFEAIVVNDGSTDNTTEVLEAYAHRPRLHILPLPGVGLAAACNAGIRVSCGQFVIRLDADDFLDPHALMVMREVLTSRPKIGLVYPDYYTVDERGRFLGYVPVPRVQEGARLLDVNPLAGGALYRRSCFDELGGYNEALRYQEDYDFWLRFIERFQAYGVGLPLLSYRQHGSSMSKNRVNRAAARRYVKREFTTTRGQLERETAVCVIPGNWPGVPERSPALLCRELGRQALLACAVEQAKAGDARARVVVVADHPDLKRLAEAAGAEVVAPPTCVPAGEDRAPLAWLRGLAIAWSKAGLALPSLLLLASPFCPLRHPDRMREALDTLLIHGCDLILSVDAESVNPWMAGAGGLAPLSPPGRALREAGELLAVRTSWLMEGRPVSDAVVGSIELLYPEWWCIKDEASRQACENLLPEAAEIRVPPSAYLRVEG